MSNSNLPGIYFEKNAISGAVVTALWLAVGEYLDYLDTPTERLTVVEWTRRDHTYMFYCRHTSGEFVQLIFDPREFQS